MEPDQLLARRLERADAWRSLEYAWAVSRRHPDVEVAVEPVAGGYLVFAGRAYPVNRAKALGLSGPVIDADLEAVEQFYRQRGLPPRLDLCPLADPTLVNLLRQRGYGLEGWQQVLARPLARDEAWPVPETVRVEEAGPDDRDRWLRTVARGFSAEEEPPATMVDILAPNFDSAIATCFLAWLDGQPAGGGALVVREGVAELCSASTRPAFRQRGVQTALIYARLAAARRAACDLAMTLTSPGSPSQRNVERAGFRLIYTKAIMVQAL